ncbi:MAG: ABC transporter substrate-binding protein [Gammaproteobacteria bacterium]|nr:MAG: ABC transporter substrate-binding protein [Gammaproteobacteria bacterium]
MEPAMKGAPRSVTALATLLLALASVAVQATTPTDTVRQTVNAVISTLQQELGEEQKRDQVFRLVADNFDFRVMAKRILATNWRKASEEQRRRFIDLFTSLLTRTYWSRIRNYRDEKVEYRGERIRKDHYARVDTEIVTADKRIPITYRLLNRDGEWKAYDVIIEGVSLVQNFRTSYQAIIRKEGIEGLLAQMAVKNGEQGGT